MQIKTSDVEDIARMAIFFLWILGFVFTAPVYARPGENIHFERISREQGLSQVSVLCIIQDRQGFMWFGTQDGLNKYDGYQFVIYRHDPGNINSLSGNYIRSIHEDTVGNLWIGTQGGGLNKFDRKTETFTRYQNQADNPKSLSHNNVLSIYGSSPCRVGGFGLDLRQHARENLQA